MVLYVFFPPIPQNYGGSRCEDNGRESQQRRAVGRPGGHRQRQRAGDGHPHLRGPPPGYAEQVSAEVPQAPRRRGGRLAAEAERGRACACECVHVRACACERASVRARRLRPWRPGTGASAARRLSRWPGGRARRSPSCSSHAGDNEPGGLSSPSSPWAPGSARCPRFKNAPLSSLLFA